MLICLEHGTLICYYLCDYVMCSKLPGNWLTKPWSPAATGDAGAGLGSRHTARAPDAPPNISTLKWPYYSVIPQII